MKKSTTDISVLIKNNKKMILKNVVRFKVTKTKSTLNLSVCIKKSLKIFKRTQGTAQSVF